MLLSVCAAYMGHLVPLRVSRHILEYKQCKEGTKGEKEKRYERKIRQLLPLVAMNEKGSIIHSHCTNTIR